MLLAQSLQSFLANDSNDEDVRKEIFRALALNKTKGEQQCSMYVY